MMARARMLSTRPSASVRTLAFALCAVALVAVLVWRFTEAGRAASTALPSSAIGRIAPDFMVADWNAPGGGSASMVRLAALRGHPVVINFWAPWCDPCQAEAPVLQAAWERVSPQGVVFVGIAEDSVAADVGSFMRQHGLVYACGPDQDGALARAYGLFALPSTVAIDRNGIIRDKIVGQLSATTLDRAIQRAQHPA